MRGWCDCVLSGEHVSVQVDRVKEKKHLCLTVFFAFFLLLAFWLGDVQIDKRTDSNVATSTHIHSHGSLPPSSL